MRMHNSRKMEKCNSTSDSSSSTEAQRRHGLRPPKTLTGNSEHIPGAVKLEKSRGEEKISYGDIGGL